MRKEVHVHTSEEYIVSFMLEYVIFRKANELAGEVKPEGQSRGSGLSFQRRRHGLSEEDGDRSDRDAMHARVDRDRDYDSDKYSYLYPCFEIRGCHR